MSIRIAVIDDHELFVSSLCCALSRASDLKVVGAVYSGSDGVELVESTRPDLALLDVSLPDIDGLGLIPALREACPTTKILVVTAHDDPVRARTALRAGASGYIAKVRPLEDLLRAIRLVNQGRTHIDVAVDGVSGVAGCGSASPASDLLSAREREVIELVALGHTNREVADLLEISSNSVSTYRARISEKLGLRGRADLVRFALDHGLLGGVSKRFDS